MTLYESNDSEHWSVTHQRSAPASTDFHGTVDMVVWENPSVAEGSERVVSERLRVSVLPRSNLRTGVSTVIRALTAEVAQ